VPTDSAEIEQDVRAALEDILAWSDVARSPQLARFLRYIVEAKLEGREAGIKAYAIAVDVFGRDAGFDPQADPIVRVQARRLRTLLDRYYAEGHGYGPIRISLPVGRYVPEFVALTEDVSLAGELTPMSPAAMLPAALPAAEAVARAPTQKLATGQPAGVWARVISVGFFAAAAVGLIYLFATWTQPSLLADSGMPAMPRVTVAEFQYLSETAPNRKSIVDGLALELVTDLGLFGDIEATYVKGGAKPEGPAEETISGVARISSNTVQYGVILTKTADQNVSWRHTITMPLAEASVDGAMDKVSRQLALMLGSQRGPLHKEARQWVRQHRAELGSASLYLCRVLFDLYRDTGAATDAAAAGKCFDGLAADQAVGLAMAAKAALGAETGTLTLTEADEMAEQAVAAAPTSSFVWEQAARVDELMGAQDEARTAYSSALQLNPANGDALAAFGRMLAMGPDWQDGDEMAATALVATPAPPAWYYAAPALNALRAGHFADAADHAEKLASADHELGPVLAVVGANHDGDGDMVNRYLPQVLDYQPFRKAGILVQLRRRLTDPDLLSQIGEGLKHAGVPEKALEGPF
jgi:Tfp pilus assembly protein PilF